MNEFDLSICIASYKVRDLLRECLRSVTEATKGIKREVIVVDNNSWDGTAEMVQKEFPDVMLSINEKNEGFARAQNKAMRHTRGRYVYLLDSDTVVRPDAFSKMLEFMDQNPSIGAAGAKLVSPNGTVQRSSRNFPTLGAVFFRGLPFRDLFSNIPSVKAYLEYNDDCINAKEVDWIFGGNAMVRREVLDSVGLYDERFYMYCEDVDWCYRMKKHGWRRFYFPQAVIIHHGGQSTKKHSFKMHREHIKSMLKLFLKHGFRIK